MTTAIVGVGHIGGALARDLLRGDEAVVLASRHAESATALAQELGPLARATSVEDAITSSHVVVFAVPLDTIKEPVSKDAALLDDKVVVDQNGGLGGRLLDLDEARLAAARPRAA